MIIPPFGGPAAETTPYQMLKMQLILMTTAPASCTAHDAKCHASGAPIA